MGNCQAIDTATLVIQHPGGRVEKLYWPVSVREVMRTNPGHYVALIITLCLPDEEKRDNNAVRITRVKVLRPTDTLVLGQAYRLITSQEVMKELWARKHAKMKRSETESIDKQQRASENPDSRCETESRTSELEKTNHMNLSNPSSLRVAKHDRHRPRTASTPSASARSKSWRPSLQSISEAGNASKQSN